MTSNEHIEEVPGRCGGRPTIRGTRVEPAMIWHLHSKMEKSLSWIVAQYPQITKEQAEAAIEYVMAHPEWKNYWHETY